MQRIVCTASPRCVLSLFSFKKLEPSSSSELARSLRPHGESTAGSHRALDSRPSDQQPYMMFQEPIFVQSYGSSYPLLRGATDRNQLLQNPSLDLISATMRFRGILTRATIQTVIHCDGSCVKPLSRTRGDGKHHA